MPAKKNAWSNGPPRDQRSSNMSVSTTNTNSLTASEVTMLVQRELEKQQGHKDIQALKGQIADMTKTNNEALQNLRKDLTAMVVTQPKTHVQHSPDKTTATVSQANLLQMAKELRAEFKSSIAESKKSVQEQLDNHHESIKKLTDQLQGIQTLIKNQATAWKEQKAGSERLEAKMTSKMDQVLAAIQVNAEENNDNKKRARTTTNLLTADPDEEELIEHACSFTEPDDSTNAEMVVEEN